MNDGQVFEYSLRTFNHGSYTGFGGLPLVGTYNDCRSDTPATVASGTGPVTGALGAELTGSYERVEVVKFLRPRTHCHWFINLHLSATFPYTDPPGNGASISPAFDLRFQLYFLPPSWFSTVDMSTLCWNNLPDPPGTTPAYTDLEKQPFLYELRLQSSYWTDETWQMQRYTPDIVAGLMFKIEGTGPSNMTTAMLIGGGGDNTPAFVFVPRNGVGYKVTSRQSSSVSKTVTIGSHDIQVGEYVRPHQIGVGYDWDKQSTSGGAWREAFPVTAVTSTTITYTASYSDTESSTACTGLIEVI